MQSQEALSKELATTLPSETEISTTPSGRLGPADHESLAISTQSVQQSRPSSSIGHSVSTRIEEPTIIYPSVSASTVSTAPEKVDFTHLYGLQSEFEAYLYKQQNEQLIRSRCDRPLIPVLHGGSSKEEQHFERRGHNQQYIVFDEEHGAEMKRLEGIMYSQAIKVGYDVQNSFNESAIRETNALNEQRNSYVQATVDAMAVKTLETELEAAKAKSKALEDGEIFVLVNRTNKPTPKYAQVVHNVKTEKISQSSKQRAENGARAVQQGLSSVSKPMPESFSSENGNVNVFAAYSSGPRDRKLMLRDAGIRTLDQFVSDDKEPNSGLLNEARLATPQHDIQLDNEEPLVYRVGLGRREAGAWQNDGPQVVAQSRRDMVGALSHNIPLPKMNVTSAYVVSNSNASSSNNVPVKEQQSQNISNSSVLYNDKSSAQQQQQQQQQHQQQQQQQQQQQLSMVQASQSMPTQLSYPHKHTNASYSTQSTRRQLRNIKEQQQQYMRKTVLLENSNTHAYTMALRPQKVNTSALLTEVVTGGYKPQQNIFHHNRNPSYLDFRKDKESINK